MQYLLADYCSLIRSILEYASIVFANFPQYLSNALEENIQKSALGIIVPSMSYSQALHLTGLPSLQERRESACIRFISNISHGNNLGQNLLRQKNILGTPTSYPHVPLATCPFPSPPTSMLIYLGHKYTVEHMTILSNID